MLTPYSGLKPEDEPMDPLAQVEKIALDRSHKFAYENTSSDYELSTQPHDGYTKSFESDEVL